MEILDNENYIQQHDTHGALTAASEEWQQLSSSLELLFTGNESTEIRQVIVAGMGGSALAGDVAQDWLELGVPLQVVRDYQLPAYVGAQTLVIASSFSGNTEETLAALREAQRKGAQVAVTAGGGQAWELAEHEQLTRIRLPKVTQPRMGVFVNLKAFLLILEKYSLIATTYTDELAAQAPWLREVSAQWISTVGSAHNLAKQLAWKCAGKTPVIYASAGMKSVAYKWKISMNENAKNVAFYSLLPEFNHNEFTGWSSHPVEKPYAVIDLISNLDHPQILKRFELSDRILSGMRPHAQAVQLQGETRLQQILWASVLGDFVSIYLGLLNGVDPTPVALIEKLKKELA